MLPCCPYVWACLGTGCFSSYSNTIVVRLKVSCCDFPVFRAVLSICEQKGLIFLLSRGVFQNIECELVSCGKKFEFDLFFLRLLWVYHNRSAKNSSSCMETVHLPTWTVTHKLSQEQEGVDHISRGVALRVPLLSPLSPSALINWKNT